MDSEKAFDRAARLVRRYRNVAIFLFFVGIAGVGIVPAHDSHDAKKLRDLELRIRYLEQVVSGKRVADVIRARTFEAVHKSGRTVGRFSANKLGGALRIDNRNGGATFRAGQDENGGGRIRVFSARGTEIFIVGENRNGSGGVAVNGSDGAMGLNLSGNHITKTGGAVLLFNKTGELIVTLQADQYGDGKVTAYDREGKGRTLKPGR